MEVMGGEQERRKYKRLLVRVGIFCRKIGSLQTCVFSGNSLNISPGGLLVESGQDAIANDGELFNIEMDMPDADSTDQIGGKVSAYARAVRIIEPQPENKSGKKQIAFQFCVRPQFDI
jgi:hypothetical protein